MLKQMCKIGCCVLVLCLISISGCSLDNSGMFVSKSLIFAHGGHGPGDGDGNDGDGYGPGDCSSDPVVSVQIYIAKGNAGSGEKGGDRPGHGHDGIKQGIGYGDGIHPGLRGGNQKGGGRPVVGALFFERRGCRQNPART